MKQIGIHFSKGVLRVNLGHKKIVIAYRVMAYIVADIVVAYIVVAYIVMA